MAQCITPMYKRNIHTDQQQVIPCGKCPPCISRRTSGWSFRIMQEEKLATMPSLFITLTYSTTHVPISANGYKTLVKTDAQKFLKRLRKSAGVNNTIRYYLCGEYGLQRRRPHFHAILINCPSDIIAKAWDKGEVYFGTVNEASVGYCLKYMCKPSFIKRNPRDDRAPEFSLHSKGLGKNYLGTFKKEKYAYCNIAEYRSSGKCRIRFIHKSVLHRPSASVNWHLRDKFQRMYCNLEDGKKVSMPRYYKAQIYHDQERKAIGARASLQVSETLDNTVDSHLAAFRKQDSQIQKRQNNEV